MKKIIALSTSLLAISLTTACSQTPMQMAPQQNLAAQNAVNAQSNANSGAKTVSLTKATPSNAVKQGTTELRLESKNQAKQAVSAPVTLSAARRDLPTSDVMTIARIGLDSMERARTYEDGYNIGRSTIDSLARQNSYIARLAQAATNPQMGYETAYKALVHALSFIANNREISISAACELVRNMMSSAKTYEDGTRIGYGTMAFIRQSASPSITAVIDSSVRAAQSTRYWEDAYNLVYNAYNSIRYMN